MKIASIAGRLFHQSLAQHVAEILTGYIRKRRNRSSASSDETISTSPDAKKIKDAKICDLGSEAAHESSDEVIEALDQIGTISEQVKAILERLNELDTIGNSVKSIEANLANLKTRTAKLEQFEITAAKDIKDLKESCSFNGDNCKELQDRFDENNTKINSLLASEKMLRDQMNELMSKNLYLEAYSRRENIKFFSIPEEDEEDTEETLRNFMEDDLGYRNARTVEIQRVHLLPRRRSDSGPRPIIARFLRYKDVEDVFSLGRHLERTEYQMFQDVPQEIIKRRRKQMPTFKEAQRNGMRVSFSKSQPDKLL